MLQSHLSGSDAVFTCLGSLRHVLQITHSTHSKFSTLLERRLDRGVVDRGVVCVAFEGVEAVAGVELLLQPRLGVRRDLADCWHETQAKEENVATEATRNDNHWNLRLQILLSVDQITTHALTQKYLDTRLHAHSSIQHNTCEVELDDLLRDGFGVSTVATVSSSSTSTSSGTSQERFGSQVFMLQNHLSVCSLMCPGTCRHLLHFSHCAHQVFR